ncbi:MAG TPA: phosphatase PAP2 family protein [Syntrophomonadaceae bacterium]|nr:phosphatase PAP2 family protein [Syntrophomonadaceae bacterium]
MANELAFDRIVKLWMENISHPTLDQYFSWITQLGSPLAFVIGGVVSMLVCIRWGKNLQGLILNLCLVSSWGIMHILKDIFGRPRPSGEHLTYATGFSFPSGHAMISMAFYGFIAYLLWTNLPHKSGKWGAYLLVILIISIGLSRVYLNVHYASDVLAGFLLGGLLVYFFACLYRYLES